MRRRWLVPALLLVGACASLASPGGGDVDLPAAGVGPFRKLDGDETLGVAPFVLDDKTKRWRDPAVLPVDPVAGGPAVLLYAAGTMGGRDVIVRTRADDGRSFFGATVGASPVVVLRADADAEAMRAPSVARVGGAILLYWADGAGVRVAVSADGLGFAKRAGYALAAAAGPSWERTPPAAPSVAVYPDGRVRMIYEAGGALGEAESADGLGFTRKGDGPVLAPSPTPDPASLAPGQKPPFDGAKVGDPCLVPRVTPAGRLHVRVLYTGTDGAGVTSIGFAARYGDAGPLSRQSQPVYAIGKGEHAPALSEWPGGALLYVAQAQTKAGDTYDALAAAFAPANLRLPAATAPADSP